MDGAVNVKVARLLPLWSCRDLEQAETEILKLVQANYFDKEIKILKDFQTQTESVPNDRHHNKEEKAVLKKSSSLNALYPYLDASGLLRVGGRIKKANLSDSLKNPVILPTTGHIRASRPPRP